MSRIAIYPGSFDPFTFGHIDIIERGSRVFDRIIVAVAHNVSKKTTFTIEERIEIIEEVFKDSKNIVVDSFKGLLVDYAKSVDTNIVLRGMRSVSDFEYELQMAHANKSLDPEIETVFMVTGRNYSYISSSLIREIVSLGGSAADLVPEIVEIKLKQKLQK